MGEAGCCGPSHAPRRGLSQAVWGTGPLRKDEANLETRIGWRRRLAALLLAVVLLVPCMPRALAADLNVDAGFYLKQSRSGTCTLTAAAMMLRRRAYLDGLADWVDVTENSVRPAAWSNGLSHSFTYKAMKVRYATLPADNGAKAQTLIDLLAAHPEGIVLYDRRQPHAILLTDYTDGVFYCSDPAGNISAGRVPISSASVSIAGSSCYWYIAEDNNAVAGAAQTSGLQLSGVTYPVNVHAGSGMSLNGTVTASSGSTLVEAAVWIEDAAGNTVMSASANLTGGESSWSVHDIDSAIRFGELPAGNYTYLLIAEDTAGDSLCFGTDFTVSDNPAVDGCYWSAQDPEGAMLQEDAASDTAQEQSKSFGSQLMDFFGSLF
mgnify:FL=1